MSQVTWWDGSLPDTFYRGNASLFVQTLLDPLHVLDSPVVLPVQSIGFRDQNGSAASSAQLDSAER